MRLHSSLLFVLPGISLVAEVRSQSYETFESTTTYHDAQQDTTAAVTGSIDSESYSLSHTEEGYIGQLSAEDDSDRPDWRRMLRNRGQCDSTTSNTFTVSEQAGVAGKAMEGEYEMEGYKQGEGNAARTNANDNSSFPPPSVPHDPTRRKIFPNQGVSYDSESTMRRYLDTEDADAEAMEDQQVGESAVDRALGKKKKATYVAAPMKAPAPIVMAAPTKKAAPMFVEPAPMIIEAAPTKKGRYLAAVDEPEGQQETEQFEQHDTTGERSLGKKKKVAYVAEPMKVAPPPMKFAPPAPAPMVMAAPTKMAPAPLFVEAAPPMKGRYLAAEDEVEAQSQTEQFENEQYDSATERGLGKKKKVVYASQPVKMAPAPVMMVAAAKAPAPMVVHAAPPPVAPAPMVVRAAPPVAPAPLVVESAPTKMAPAPMAIESAPTMMATARVIIESAPTKMAPAPMAIESAPTKMAPAPMAVESAPPMTASARVVIESAPSKMQSAPMVVEAASSKMEPAPMAIESAPTEVEPAPLVIESASSKMEPAPMAFEAAPTEIEPAAVVIEAAHSMKGRYLAAVDEAEVQYEAEQFETEQFDTAGERGLGKKKKVAYVAEPMKVAPPPMKFAPPAPAPMVMAAPTKMAPAPLFVEAAPPMKGRYLAAEDEPEVQLETENFETEQYDTAGQRSLGKKKKATYVAAPMKAPAPIVMAAPTKKAAPMFVEPAPMIIEAAPTKKGRYLAAVDEPEGQQETEQFEQHDTTGERSLGKKKKVAYVAEPMKVAPPPMKFAPPAPAPMVMAAPTKMAPAPLFVEAAPPMKGRYLAAEDEPEVQLETENFETEQYDTAGQRSLGKKKKATYVAAPMKAPAPIVMAAPTKKAAPMFVEPAPMIIEAAPTKKGRYLAAVDEPEGQQETEQFEQHDTTGERSLGKKKKVAYVAEPMKVAPPPMKFAPPAPAPMVMAAPTKMAPAPLFVEAAPPMKGRYLAAEDEVEAQSQTEQFETEQYDSATERGLGKKKKKAVAAAPVKMAPAPVMMVAAAKAPAPMVVRAAPTKAPAPMVVRAAPTKAPPPMVVEAAPTKMAPAPLVVESAPTKMAPAPMVIEAAPTKKGRYLAAADEPEGQQETEQFEQHDTTGERSLGKKKKVAYVAEPMKVAPPPMKFAPPAPAPMVMAAPTKMAPAPLFVEAAPPMKGRYLAAEDEPEVQLEAENFETEQYDSATERGLGKKKKAVAAAPVKMAPAPVMMAPVAKAPAPMVVHAAPPPMVVEAAPTKMAPAPLVVESAPTKMAPAPLVVESAPLMKGRYLAAEYVDAEAE